MSDASDPKHIQSFFSQKPNPAWLLRDDQVNRILNTLPNKMDIDLITQHMMAAEKAAYEKGLTKATELAEACRELHVEDSDAFGETYRKIARALKAFSV